MITGASYKAFIIALAVLFINFDCNAIQSSKSSIGTFFKNGYHNNPTATIATAAGLAGATYFVLKKWLWTARNPKPTFKGLGVTTLKRECVEIDESKKISGQMEHAVKSKTAVKNIVHHQGIPAWLKNQHNIFIYLPGYSSGGGNNTGRYFYNLSKKFKGKNAIKPTILQKLIGSLASNWNLGPRSTHNLMKYNIIPSQETIIDEDRFIHGLDENNAAEKIVKDRRIRSKELKQKLRDLYKDDPKELAKRMAALTAKERLPEEFPACITYNANDYHGSLNFGQTLDQKDFKFVLKEICKVNKKANIFVFGLCRGALIALNSIASAHTRQEKALMSRIKGAVILEPANPNVVKIQPIMVTIARTLGLLPNYKPKSPSILDATYFPKMPVFLGHIQGDGSLPDMNQLNKKLSSLGCHVTNYASSLTIHHGKLMTDNKCIRELQQFYEKHNLMTNE